MDKRRSKVETDFADAALALLMDWSAESDGEQLWDEYCTAEQQMPPELDAICRNRIQKYAKRSRRRGGFVRMLKTSGQAAACLAIILFFAISLITSVEALRVPVLNFILKHSEQATAIIFQHEPTQKETQLEELLNILKESAPEGYSLEIENIYRDNYSNPPVITSIFMGFQDAGSNLLSIHVTPAEGTMNVDTEDASVTRITLEDQYAMLIEKAPEIRMIWINETQGLLYSVTASAMEKADFMEYVAILAHETRYSNAGFTE